MEHNPLPAGPADQVPGPFSTCQYSSPTSASSAPEQRENSACFCSMNQDALTTGSFFLSVSFRVSVLALLSLGEEGGETVGSIALVTQPPFAG